MGDTPVRLLKLLSLLQVPRAWPGSELARRLGVSARTVRRDVDRLRHLGYPVEATMGAEGGYRLVAGSALPPLLLDDDEAVAIAVGLRIAAGHAVEGIDEASVRALTKLEQVLPGRLRRRVAVLGAATSAFPHGDGAAVDPRVLTALAGAIANRERVRFTYRAAGRLVEPHGLVAAGRRWYLPAFDVDRDDWRVFRVDRIRDPLATGVRCASRALPAANAAEFLRDRSYSLAPTHRAAAAVHLPADEVTRRLGTAVATAEPLDERSCRVVLHPDTVEWLAFRLTGLGCEFEVREPAELVAHLRDLGDRVGRAVRR
ncbi:helix-turn-helix transcriptional regulator [Saccharothrix syringae]|uniref:YafY family transcriptional regulator n=1 Tax=Saccharothrix syringae TaxID=103733 RepID=A0A5Q0H0V2_SACSY|nr:YafY family protein [Saccharothrix syringae]QFZ19733.1 YafY family transcriptional regulator [Saccharothrix syringae]